MVEMEGVRNLHSRKGSENMTDELIKTIENLVEKRASEDEIKSVIVELLKRYVYGGKD